MTRPRGFPSALAVSSPLVAVMLLAAAAGTGPASPVAAATTGRQVTGEAEVELQLTPAEHGRLVEVLATEAESREWDALADPQAREAFLERFWRLRDPTPGTPDNEVRDLFMRRAARAATMFGEGGVPGWATPRGRALLVYGLPEEQERRVTDGRTELRWTWSDAPGSLTIRFSPAADGGWVMQEASDPDLDWGAFAANAGERLQLPVSRADFDPAEDDEEDDEEAPTEGTEAVAPPPMPPETVAWLRMVRDGEIRRDFPLEQRVYFFPAPDGTFVLVGFSPGTSTLAFEPVEAGEDDADQEEDGEDDGGGEETREGGEGDTAAAEGVGAGEAVEDRADEDRAGDREAADAEVDSGEERAALRAFGGILGDLGGEPQVVHQFNIPFTVTRDASTVEDPRAALSGEPGQDTSGPRDGTAVRSFGVTLAPGTYRLAWGVLDTVSDRMTMADEMIRVPEFSGDELRLSSIILARPPHAQTSGTMSVAEVYRGLRLGSSLLDADIARVFGRNERFEVVFIVSGWQEEPTTPGRPRLELEYRVLRVEADGNRVSIARLPVQALSFHAVGQEIPLSQIRQIEPGGSYEVEITVRDLVAGTQVVETVPFSVAPEPERMEPEAR